MTEDEPIGPDDVEEHVVRASGLSSGVPTDADATDVAGHVVMLDYDGCEDVLAPIGDLDRMSGVSVLLESSPGSFHGFNLTVRPFADAIVVGARSNSDLEHVRQSARRGYYVLRWTRKILDKTGETYKEAPRVRWASVSETDREQSGPHIEALERAAREDGMETIAERLAIARDELPTVGERILVDHYKTADDDLKAAMRAGGRE
jgi:hypothetical protein